MSTRAIILFALLPIIGPSLSACAVDRSASPAPAVSAPDISRRDLAIDAAGLGRMQAAVFRPRGRGPFPAVLLLHGTHGYAQEYVALAETLARSGVIAMAGCWFEGRRGAGVRFVTPIECPGAPPFMDGDDPRALAVIDALLDALRAQDGVRAERVFLFGHSRGAAAALNYAARRADRVRGIVLNSGPYPPEFVELGVELHARVLLLHGTADDATQGGSPMTAPPRAHAFESALRDAGVPIEAVYFEQAGHNALFLDARQRERTVQEIVRFMRGNRR